MNILFYVSAFCLGFAYGWWGMLITFTVYCAVELVLWKRRKDFDKNMREVVEMINKKNEVFKLAQYRVVS